MKIKNNNQNLYIKSLEVSAKGVAQLLKENNLTVSDLRPHHDWSRKDCPAQIRAGKDEVGWNEFKAMVQKAYDGKTVTKPLQNLNHSRSLRERKGNMKIKNDNQNLYKFKAEQAYIRYLKHREDGVTKRASQHRALSDVGIDIRKELDAVNHLEKIIKHEAAPSLGMIKRYITKRKKPSYRGILLNGRTVLRGGY